MKLVKTNVTEIKMKGLRSTDLFETLEEFSSSGWEAAKIEDYTHKTATGCASAFRSAIRRYHKPHIKVSVRGDDVYLINKIF